ncbi:MAG: hypothetical protein ABEJ61_08685 [Haloferacaceae archaeon]
MAGDAPDPETRYGIYASLALIVLGAGLNALAGVVGASGLTALSTPIIYLGGAVGAVSAALDAHLLVERGVEWGRIRYVHAPLTLFVPIWIGVYHWRRSVHRRQHDLAARGPGGSGATAPFDGGDGATDSASEE